MRQQNVVEVAGQFAAVALATLEEQLDTLGQLAKLIGTDLATHKARPINPQGSRLAAQIIDQRRALLHQIHSAVSGFLGHAHNVVETFGGITDLRHLLRMGAVQIDLKVDDGVVQLTS